jgi:hypothetical protein
MPSLDSMEVKSETLLRFVAIMEWNEHCKATMLDEGPFKSFQFTF